MARGIANGAVSFTLSRPLSSSEILELEAISGVAAWPQRVDAPLNAVQVVARLLTLQSVGYSVLMGANENQATIKDATRALRHLHPWVPEFLVPYQPVGILDVISRMPNGSGHLWWSTGSGKTLAALIWALAGVGRIVVVTKAAVKLQWQDEVERFSTVSPVVLDGVEPRTLTENDVFVICSYEILPAWIGELERWAKGWAVRPSVVFDESQKVQSHRRWDATVDNENADIVVDGEQKVKFKLKENIAAAAYRLSRVAGRRLATTATPINDRVRNLWAQLDLVHPGKWGPYWDWARRYCGAYQNALGNWVDGGQTNVDELVERLAVVSHRVTFAEANRFLPPKRRIVTRVAVADQVRSGMVARVRAAARQGPGALREALLMEAAARKRRRLIEKLDMDVEGGLKSVVFTGRREDCDILLEQAGARYAGKALVVGGHGEQSVEERDAARQAYMAAPGPAILIGTTAAWGEGLNLQDTDHLLVALLPYTPGAVVQAEGRVSRLGQTRPVLIEYLVAVGTYDERVAGILIGKLPAVERIAGQDEVSGFARELSGADDEGIMASLVAAILKPTVEKETVE